MTTLAKKTIIASLKQSFIRFDHVENLLNKLEGLYSRDDSDEEPENLFVIGESGVGKSRLMEKFNNLHPRIIHPEFTEIPVLYVNAPSKGSVSSLTNAILYQLGSPFWDRGTTNQQTQQIINLFAACKVRILILGEINHLIDKGGSKTHHNVADWIKELSDAVKKPFVLCGIPRSVRLLNTNDQLRGRFREIITIKQFSVENENSTKEFCGVLKAMSKMLKGIETINLSSATMARNMAFATDGRIREIRRLLVRVVELAFENPSEGITPQIFAKAFEQVIFIGAPNTRNPFCADFIQVPLTKIGEPFAPRGELYA